MAVELIQVFSSRGLPNEVRDKLISHYEQSDDSYLRWHPAQEEQEWSYIRQDTIDIVNAFCEAQGGGNR